MGRPSLSGVVPPGHRSGPLPDVVPCPRLAPASQPPLRRPCAAQPLPTSADDFSGRVTMASPLRTENSASFTNVISIEGSFPISFHLSPNRAPSRALMARLDSSEAAAAWSGAAANWEGCFIRKRRRPQAAVGCCGLSPQITVME